MQSQKTQQVTTSENLQQLQDEIGQKISEMLANSNFKDLLEKYGISQPESLGFQYTIDLSNLEDREKLNFLDSPDGSNPQISFQFTRCICWSCTEQIWVRSSCPCQMC
jgi:hypothetical protein